jgi:DNA-directed RNA polymerase specialized sigma24 family protein
MSLVDDLLDAAPNLPGLDPALAATRAGACERLAAELETLWRRSRHRWPSDSSYDDVGLAVLVKLVAAGPMRGTGRTFATVSRARAFLHTCLRNQAVDEYRRRLRERQAAEPARRSGRPLPPPPAGADLEEWAVAELFGRAVACLADEATKRAIADMRGLVRGELAFPDVVRRIWHDTSPQSCAAVYKQHQRVRAALVALVRTAAVAGTYSAAQEQALRFVIDTHLRRRQRRPQSTATGMSPRATPRGQDTLRVRRRRRRRPGTGRDDEE